MKANDISIVISGEAGRGIQTLEQLALRVMKSAGYHVFACGEFMSRIRGGNNSSEIRVSSERIAAYVDRIDVFFAINADAMSRFSGRITPATAIIAQDEHIDERFRDGTYRLAPLPLAAAAESAGGTGMINIVVLGVICALMGVDRSLAAGIAGDRFGSTPDDRKGKSAAAIDAGYRLYEERLAGILPAPGFAPAVIDRSNPLLYGSEAIGIGALMGGCDFVTSYPMSPSTSVLQFMAQHARRFEIVFEQAEDEIAAINMAIGAWYAGARAMVTTSGGGFALMTEGLSLAGCIESPLVVHIGQRPGPATGLPTRTEQADLLMALHAGHGEFPRIILAPANKNDGVMLTCRAFSLADRHQVPVIILTDQYFLDSAYDVADLSIGDTRPERYIAETPADYRRYRLTDSGVSPRGVPGNGEGFVCVDSDEHDEYGLITEDPGKRVDMVNKRMCKYTAIDSDIMPPRFIGRQAYEYLIVGWGSTLNVLVEALASLKRDNLSLLHFSQVYPLHASVAAYLERAAVAIIVEGNATAQFGSLIRRETGFAFHHEILKFDGMPFSVEEIADWITDILPEKA